MSSVCSSCIHFDQDSIEGMSPSCAAFPKGIPLEILTFGGHDKPFTGDRGIQFERMTKDQQRRMVRNDLGLKVDGTKK